ncbi:hypothetical protein X777_07806, partial [Ooceraea biroi]
ELRTLIVVGWCSPQDYLVWCTSKGESITARALWSRMDSGDHRSTSRLCSSPVPPRTERSLDARAQTVEKVNKETAGTRTSRHVARGETVPGTRNGEHLCR